MNQRIFSQTIRKYSYRLGFDEIYLSKIWNCSLRLVFQLVTWSGISVIESLDYDIVGW